MTDWIEWNGGECPVGGENLVQVRLRDGHEDGATDYSRACDIIWTHCNNRTWEVVAYRHYRHGAPQQPLADSALTHHPSGTHYDSDSHYVSPVTAPGAVTMDERPGDYLEDRQPTSASRYPSPATAELVTLWRKDRRVVMSITAGGQTQDFYMPPGRLAYLIKEIAEQLAENTLIQ